MKKEENNENIEEIVSSEEAVNCNIHEGERTERDIKAEIQDRYQEEDPYAIIGELELQVSNLQKDYDDLKNEYEKMIGEKESLNNIISSQANQIQILNSNLERSDVTLDAVQEKLIRVIRLYNNKN